jgi:CRISPR-associated protein Csx10
MKYLALSLEALSPLAIRADHSLEGADATPYISGTALAGSLAAVHRLYHPDNTEDFEKLFLSGQVQYPDLYPATFKNERKHSEAVEQAITLPVYPLPKTAQSCKRFSGFLPFKDTEEKDIEDTEEEDANHGVRDSLIDWALFRLADRANEARTEKVDASVLIDPFQKYKLCPVCQKKGDERPMDSFSAYYRRIGQDGLMMSARTDITRLQTHTGINRDTGTVQEGILYNRRVFDEHTRFWGMVKIADELARTFMQYIEEVGSSGLVRVGTGRTRGMGKVSISIEPIGDEGEHFQTFRQHLTAFNKKLRGAADLFSSKKGLTLDLRPFYFALTLHSPVILRDASLRYRGIIDKDVLADLGLPADHITLIHQAASTRRVTGWNDLWGTPRTNEIAIDTGSVFLFESTLARSDLEKALFRIESEGIGQRRAEGFGRICVSDPFHCEVELQYE